ncbi:MAG: hypothetical protein U0802_24990 [Candidatus Binatia bacterium]
MQIAATARGRALLLDGRRPPPRRTRWPAGWRTWRRRISTILAHAAAVMERVAGRL